MKYYPNDIVRDKQSGKEYEVSHVSNCGNIDLNVDGRFWFSLELAKDQLTLIRRADEPEWPADVPRCELRLLKSNERYVFMGDKHWSPGCPFYWDGKWQVSHGPVSGDPRLPTCKAVNDEDHVPPQLSETTNSSQVESKITVNRLTELYHKDLHESNVAQILDGHVVIQSMDIRLKPHHALALAELLTAAAKEAQQ